MGAEDRVGEQRGARTTYRAKPIPEVKARTTQDQLSGGEPHASQESAMNSRKVGKLSHGQRECLKRVMLHKSSKEIAIELGISPHTVDQRLRAAIKILDVSNRFEAARLLAASDSLVQYQQPVYQTLSVEHEAHLHEPESVGNGAEIQDCEPSKNQDDEKTRLSDGSQEFLLKLIDKPGIDRESFASLFLYRVGIILGLSLVIAMAFGMFMAGFEALIRLTSSNA